MYTGAQQATDINDSGIGDVSINPSTPLGSAKNGK